MMIKKFISKVLDRFGYRICRSVSNTDGPSLLNRNIEDVLSQIHKMGFLPATVIDVGVAYGTPGLYERFPDAYFLLIEPLAEFMECAQRWLDNVRGELILAAASSRDGEVTINVHQDHLSGSSLLREQMGSEFDGLLRQVPSVRLDTITKQKNLSGPFLLKVDVQGAELDVLAGATEVLKETEFVILEASLFEFMKGGPLFSDVIAYMKMHGFVAYDIYGGTRRPLDDALGQVDIAFVKENGMFRNDSRYATAAQWAQITRKD